MTDEKFTCDKCGKSFDSQRGLSIHQTQMHEDEDSGDQNEEIPDPYSGDDSSRMVSLSVQQVMIGIFVLGLSLGFSTGLAATNFGAISGLLDADPLQQEQSTVDVLADIADETGLNPEEMRNYIQSSNGSEIQRDRAEISQAVGGIGTPSFFIGNSEIGYTHVSGAQPYPRMKPLIDQKIQEAENNDSEVGGDEYTLEGITSEGEPTLGDKSANIRIIEYSDYGCPWCAEWHGINAIPQRPIDQEESFQRVRTNYVETGKVQFIKKDYPVPRLHPEAVNAHKAANYVWENSPEHFWEFSHKLYEERDRW